MNRNPIDTCYDLPIAILADALQGVKAALGDKDHPRPYKELYADSQDIEGAIAHLRVIKAGGGRNIISLLLNIVTSASKGVEEKELLGDTFIDLANNLQMLRDFVGAKDQIGVMSCIGDTATCLIYLSHWANTTLETCMLSTYDHITSTVDTTTIP